jgi:hypothetical protein
MPDSGTRPTGAAAENVRPVERLENDLPCSPLLCFGLRTAVLRDSLSVGIEELYLPIPSGKPIHDAHCPAWFASKTNTLSRAKRNKRNDLPILFSGAGIANTGPGRISASAQSKNSSGENNFLRWLGCAISQRLNRCRSRLLWSSRLIRFRP